MESLTHKLENVSNPFADKVNIEKNERIASAVTGSVLVYRAFKKKSFLRGLAGGYMLFRGATGYCPISELVGKDLASAVMDR